MGGLAERLAERLRAPRVVVYTRRRCGLCATAEAHARAEAPADRLTFVDIDTDEQLLRRFHIRVPVVEVDDRVVAEGIVAAGEVARAVRAARRRRLLGG